MKQDGKAVLKVWLLFVIKQLKYSALIDMADNLNDPGACSEAESLADAILEFSFLVSVVFWHRNYTCLHMESI